MFYLLHGDDEFTSREHLKKIRQEAHFDFNQNVFSGSDTPLKTILDTADTMPFLTEQRLVVVEGLPKKKRSEAAGDAPPAVEGTPKGPRGNKSKKGSKPAAMTRAGFEKALAEYCSSIPETTVLVLLLDEPLEATHALLKAAEKHGKVVQSTVPKGAALEKWITKRTQSQGARIVPEAVTLLANFIGGNLRMLANELDKLSTFAGKGGTITAETVHQLSAQVQEARVFDLTDAIAQRNRKQALNILHDLLSDGEPPIKLLSLITSQVRSLLLVKELAQKGMRGQQIASTIGMSPFVADKALRQVGNFTVPQLENAYRQLLATDAALKRSRLAPEMALDLLIISFGT